VDAIATSARLQQIRANVHSEVRMETKAVEKARLLVRTNALSIETPILKH